MPRMKSKTVPGCYYDPVLLDEYKEGRLTMEELYRTFAEEF